MVNKQLSKMREAICFLSSMVEGGENHSDHSRCIVREALNVSDMEQGMTDKEFRALLDLMMCSDPWPVCDKYGVVDLNSDVTLLSLVDKESEKRGFQDWIDAFHCFMKPRAIVGPTPRG